MFSEIRRYVPDIIVGTQAFAVTVVSKLKKRKLIQNEHKLRIVVVHGNNKTLKEALDKEYSRKVNNKEVLIIGFTTNIPKHMDEADVIITKSGGLTVSESIAKRLPMLLQYAIPDQEKENMAFLFSSRAAADVRKLDNFNYVLNNLIKNPEKLNDMRENLDRIFEDYSIEGIVELSDRLINHYIGIEYFENRVMKVAR